MGRLLGVVSLVLIFYTILYFVNDNAFTWFNLKNISNFQGQYGIIALGVAVLIITGGIDLSIGSVVGLSSVLFITFIEAKIHPYPAVILVLCCGLLIGLIHGLLVTLLKLQPFLVTLCGLFIYRGLAKALADQDVGVAQLLKSLNDDPEFQSKVQASLDQLSWVLTGYWEAKPVFPGIFILMAIITLLLALFIHGTVYGRYMFALGQNEKGAEYAGIRINRYKILAYMICSFLAALGGIIYVLYVPSSSPASAGDKYELYAITSAVLGGCSLRGGAGNIVGVAVAASIIPVIGNLCTFMRVDDAIEFAVTGLALLLGTIADEFFRQRPLRGVSGAQPFWLRLFRRRSGNSS